MARLTDNPEMTITIYLVRYATKQLYQLLLSFLTEVDREGPFNLF